jgi:hypothetical protein
MKRALWSLALLALLSVSLPVEAANKSGPAPSPKVKALVDKLIDTRFTVDMKNAPDGSAENAAGHPRNGPWFWRELLKKHPEVFDSENSVAIRAGRAPVVNAKWVKILPNYRPYLKDKLVHHHIDQGRIAAPLPESVHRQYHAELHPVR